MPGPSPISWQRLRRSRVVARAAVAGAAGLVRVVAALPSRWIPPLAVGCGAAMAYLNVRGRRIALQNLEAVYGPELARRERRHIVRRSYQNTARSVLLLMHLQPLTPARFREWVDTGEALDEQPRLQRLTTQGGLLVSGHVGNWELLLGLRVVYPDLPPTVFLAEAIPHEAINDLLVKLRSHGDLRTALRRGGARAVARTVQAGGIAGLLVDRNVRRALGGIYVPFLGLAARTTPLPAWVARKANVPVHPIFCLPAGDGRYRIEVGDDVTSGVDRSDPEAHDLVVTRRLNAAIEAVIRADPGLWQWALKRFKSRPHAARGSHPRYSVHDPDLPGGTTP